MTITMLYCIIIGKLKETFMKKSIGKIYYMQAMLNIPRKVFKIMFSDFKNDFSKIVLFFKIV